MNLCFTCHYELELSLKDACGVEYIPTLQQKQDVGTLDMLDWECNGNVKFVNQPNPISVFANAGEYVFTKILRIKEGTLDTYVDNYLGNLNNGCIKSYEEFLGEEVLAIKNKFCDYKCEDCENDLTTMEANEAAIISLIAGNNLSSEMLAEKTAELETFAIRYRFADRNL